MSFTLRAAYSKTGLLRMVAHRDMGTHIRRMCHRMELPVSYSQGFNPRPKFHFSPPLPLGAVCKQDWMDFDLDSAVTAEDFLEAVKLQTLEGLEWVGAVALGGGEAGLQDLLQYAEWTFQPYQPEETKELVETFFKAATGEKLLYQKMSKRGRPRQIDVRPMIKSVLREGEGLRIVLGASPSAAEGAIGLFDFLRSCLPDLAVHPLTLFEISRERFLRAENGQLVDSVAASRFDQESC